MEYKELGRPNITRVPIIVENITAVAFNIRDHCVYLADDISKSIMKLNLTRNYTIETILTDTKIEHVKSIDFGKNSKKLNVYDFK